MKNFGTSFVSLNSMKKIVMGCMLLAAFGCNRYELDFEEEIIARNFIATMNENPANGFEIGRIEASSSYNRITYEILSQSPEGAIDVLDKKVGGGIITVADSSLFDYEKYPVIESRVRIYNPDDADTIDIRLTLRDRPE